jgi:hypothetical protein
VILEENIARVKEGKNNMPYGPGTYGKKKGRPPKKKKVKKKK